MEKNVFQGFWRGFGIDKMSYKIKCSNKFNNLSIFDYFITTRVQDIIFKYLDNESLFKLLTYKGRNYNKYIKRLIYNSLSTQIEFTFIASKVDWKKELQLELSQRKQMQIQQQQQQQAIANMEEKKDKEKEIESVNEELKGLTTSSGPIVTRVIKNVCKLYPKNTIDSCTTSYYWICPHG